MMPSEFTIDVQVMQQRVRYVERKRAATLRIECDADNNWWLRPETLQWWERAIADGSLARESVDAVKSPISDSERDAILDRVAAHMREQHKMWTNIRGRTDDARPAGWRAPPVRSDVDPELAFIVGDMDADAPDSTSPRDDAQVLADIDAAIGQIEPMAMQGWDEAQSILRQLHWCRGTLRGELVEPAPGPLSMGLIATREFDMYGQQPELASLINAIQSEMRRRGCA